MAKISGDQAIRSWFIFLTHRTSVPVLPGKTLKHRNCIFLLKYHTPCFIKKRLDPLLFHHLSSNSYELHENFQYIGGAACCGYGINVCYLLLYAVILILHFLFFKHNRSILGFIFYITPFTTDHFCINVHVLYGCVHKLAQSDPGIDT